MSKPSHSDPELPEDGADLSREVVGDLPHDVATDQGEPQAAVDQTQTPPTVLDQGPVAASPHGTPTAADSGAVAPSPHSAPAIPAVPLATAATGSRSSGFWRSAQGAWARGWSTTVGKVAMIGAGVFVVLGLVGVVGLGALALGRADYLRHGGADWTCREGQPFGREAGGQVGRGGGRESGQGRCPEGAWGHGGDSQLRGPGERGPGQMGQGQMGQGQMGQGQRPWGPNEGPNAGSQNGGSLGLPGMAGGAPSSSGPMSGLLAGVLHGEFVVAGSAPTTMLFQVGTVTEYTAGTSISVKSGDGFAATYAVGADMLRPEGLVKGATVRVLADKEGSTAIRILVVSAGATGSNQ